MIFKNHPVMKLTLLGGAALFMGFMATAWAQEGPQGRPAPMDLVKMEAVRACAKAKGVDMPAPPPQGERPQMGERPAGPPPAAKDGERQGPPRLSEEQRKIVEACFEASGLTPPRGPHGPK